MSDVINFTLEKEKRKPVNTHHMLTLDLYMTADEKYEVMMETNGDFDDDEIGSALMATAMKFVIDHELVEEIEVESEEDDSNT